MTLHPLQCKCPDQPGQLSRTTAPPRDGQSCQDTARMPPGCRSTSPPGSPPSTSVCLSRGCISAHLSRSSLLFGCWPNRDGGHISSAPTPENAEPQASLGKQVCGCDQRTRGHNLWIRSNCQQKPESAVQLYDEILKVLSFVPVHIDPQLSPRTVT